jgi:hypothetical protein
VKTVMNLRVPKTREISWQTNVLLASQEELCPMELSVSVGRCVHRLFNDHVSVARLYGIKYDGMKFMHDEIQHLQLQRTSRYGPNHQTPHYGHAVLLPRSELGTSKR